jgi:immune inhibitor A
MKRILVRQFDARLWAWAAAGACFLVEPGRATGGDAPGSPGRQVEKGIVLLVEFPDVTHGVDRQVVQTRFTRHLDAYVREMSYQRVSLDIAVTPRWYRMPDPVGQYRISPRNLEVDRARVRKLIEDALGAAEREIQFSRYDFVAILLGAKLSDYGMIGLCGYPGMLGWSETAALKTRSGQVVRGVAIYSFQAHLGTLFHDVAHVLGGVREGKRGVPCLYDHDLQAKPGPLRQTAIDAMIHLGFWDPMSCHFYKRNLPPPGLCSWTKRRLGWINPSQTRVVPPGQSAEVLLGPLEIGASETLVIQIPLSPTSYYLIENRQPIGFDRNLPGSGVLILQADDTVAECRQGRAPVRLINANPSVPHLEGAAFDIGKRDICRDEANRLQILLAAKVGDSYQVRIRRW